MKNEETVSNMKKGFTQHRNFCKLFSTWQIYLFWNWSMTKLLKWLGWNQYVSILVRFNKYKSCWYKKWFKNIEIKEIAHISKYQVMYEKNIRVFVILFTSNNFLFLFVFK